jgi:hypothetical protein
MLIAQTTFYRQSESQLVVKFEGREHTELELWPHGQLSVKKEGKVNEYTGYRCCSVPLSVVSNNMENRLIHHNHRELSWTGSCHRRSGWVKRRGRICEKGRELEGEWKIQNTGTALCHSAWFPTAWKIDCTITITESVHEQGHASARVDGHRAQALDSIGGICNRMLNPADPDLP